VAVTDARTPSGVIVCAHASWALSQEGAATLLTVNGELDSACAGAFAAAVATVANNGSAAILDLAGVTFVDSAAVDAIDRLRRLFAILELALAVRSPSRAVRRMLTLYRLDGLLEHLEPTAAEMFGPTRPGQAGFGTGTPFES
jgi:anti-anti-sigma factor